MHSGLSGPAHAGSVVSRVVKAFPRTLQVSLVGFGPHPGSEVEVKVMGAKVIGGSRGSESGVARAHERRAAMTTKNVFILLVAVSD